MTDSVFDPLPEHTEMVSRLELPKALRGGTRAMRAGKRKWLPQYPKEEDPDYDKRLNSTFLYPGYARAIDNHAGRVFSEPIGIRDGAPEVVEAWMENVDLKGTRLNSWAPDVFKTGEDCGLTHIFVDQAQLPAGATQSDAARGGVRPYWIHISPLDLIGWRYEWTREGDRLTQIRFLERVQVSEGRWGATTIERCRVIEPGFFQVYEKGTNSEGQAVDVLVEEGEFGLDEIPLATFYARQTGVLTARPFNEELGDKNLEHWQSSSDQRNALRYARVPWYSFLGITKDEFDAIEGIGSAMAVHSTNAEAQVGAIEQPTGAIEIGRTDLLDLERQMEVLARRPLLTQRPGGVTATETAVETSEAHSDIQNLAIRFEDPLNQAVRFSAKWAGIEIEEGPLDVFKDFAIEAGKGEVGDLIALERDVKITHEVLLDEMKRRDILSDKVDVGEQVKLLGDGRLDASAFGMERGRIRRALELVQSGVSIDEAIDQVQADRPELRLIG